MPKNPSPWIAWPAGSDPVELSARLRAAHELFMTGDVVMDLGRLRGTVGPVRRVVMDSWVRSRSGGVDPERPRPPVEFSGADLVAFRREHVLAPLMPIVRRLLIDGAGSEGMIVALADETGRLLWVDGDRVVRRDIEQVGFVEGARWGEQDAGTNAPGVALATDHAVQVLGAEHFTRAVQQWSCSAAPVHDPVTGRLLGVLDITGREPAASPLMLSLVRATVAAMESELAVRALQGRLSESGSVSGRRRILGQRRRDGAGALSQRGPEYRADARLEVLGTSSGALVRDGGRQALTLRHSELLLLLGTHPAGLTGDELAALLHPGNLSDVTVRAEMSRLRRAVGGLVGESRPYRLTDRFPDRLTCDIDDVRDRLARGDVAGAVEAYRGPVLPRSEAPGVVAVREALDAELRAALSRTRDQDALETWTLGSVGADDWDAWQRLLVLLPEGSPGWIRARARIDVLDRELGVTVGPTVARSAQQPLRRTER